MDRVDSPVQFGHDDVLGLVCGCAGGEVDAVGDVAASQIIILYICMEQVLLVTLKIC